MTHRASTPVVCTLLLCLRRFLVRLVCLPFIPAIWLAVRLRHRQLAPRHVSTLDLVHLSSQEYESKPASMGRALSEVWHRLVLAHLTTLDNKTMPVELKIAFALDVLALSWWPYHRPAPKLTLAQALARLIVKMGTPVNGNAERTFAEAESRNSQVLRLSKQVRCSQVSWAWIGRFWHNVV